MAERPADPSSVDAQGIRPPDAFAIARRDAAGGLLVLQLEGEFDLAATSALREQFDAARAAAERGVVCDIAEVTFVDSSGLRELLRASRALQADGKAFVLAAPQPAITRLLELTGVTDSLDTAPTLERALTRLAARP